MTLYKLSWSVIACSSMQVCNETSATADFYCQKCLPRCCRTRKGLHLELQPVVTPYGTLRPRGGSLQGVWSTPIPAKPPELLPEVVHALAEVHLHEYKACKVFQH